MFEESKLHKKLQEIIKQDVSEHVRLIKELEVRIPHSIEIISSNEYEGVPISNFMCFEFAFDLFYSKKYRDILESQGRWRINPIGADKDFFLFLKRNNSIKEIYFGDVTDDDLIIYYEDSQPLHAGKMTKTRVISKWGAGLLLNHEIHEVPELFGNTVKFYEPISLEDCIELFIDYAEERGLQFQIIDD